MSNIVRTALSINEAAETLGIGRTSIYKLLKAKRLPIVKIGRRTLIPAAALSDFLASLGQDVAA